MKPATGTARAPVGRSGDRPGQGRHDGGAGDGQDQHEGADRLGGDRPGEAALELVAVQEYDRASASASLT